MKPPLAIAVLIVSLDEAVTARSATRHQLPPRAASFYRAYPLRSSRNFAFVPSLHAAASVSSLPCTAAARALRGGGSGDAGSAKFPEDVAGGKEAAALKREGLDASKKRGKTTIEPAQQGLKNAVDVSDKNTGTAVTATAEAAAAAATAAAADVNTRGKGLAEGDDLVENAKGSSVDGGGGGGSDLHEGIAVVGRKPAAAGAATARKHDHVDAKEEALREALLVADGPNK